MMSRSQNRHKKTIGEFFSSAGVVSNATANVSSALQPVDFTKSMGKNFPADLDSVYNLVSTSECNLESISYLAMVGKTKTIVKPASATLNAEHITRIRCADERSGKVDCVCETISRSNSVTKKGIEPPSVIADDLSNLPEGVTPMQMRNSKEFSAASSIFIPGNAPAVCSNSTTAEAIDDEAKKTSNKSCADAAKEAKKCKPQPSGCLADCKCAQCVNAAELIAEEEREAAVAIAKKKKPKKKNNKANKNKGKKADAKEERGAHETSDEEHDDVDIGSLATKRLPVINTENIVSADLYKKCVETKFAHELENDKKEDDKTKRQMKELTTALEAISKPEDGLKQTKRIAQVVKEHPVSEKSAAKTKVSMSHSTDAGESSESAEWIQVTKSAKTKGTAIEATGVITSENTPGKAKSRPSLTQSEPQDQYEIELNLFPVPGKPSILNGVAIHELNIPAYKAKLLMIDAQLSEARGNFDLALMLATMAIQHDQFNPLLFANRAYYLEKLEIFEDALADANRAIQLDRAQEYIYSNYIRRFRAEVGLCRWEAAEHTIMSLIAIDRKNSTTGGLDHQALLCKEAMVMRLKALVSHDYTLTLARLYAQRFGTFGKALKALNANVKYLEKKSDKNPYDERLHKELIKRQMSERNGHHNGHLRGQANGGSQGEEEEEEEDDGVVLPCDSDDEFYFSDDDEHDMFYGDVDKFAHPKDIIKLRGQRKRGGLTVMPSDETTFLGHRLLWVKNILPDVSPKYLTHVLMKFGNVTMLRLYSAEKSQSNSMLVHFDNGISARVAKAYLQGQVLEGINKEYGRAPLPPLVVRYQNKENNPGGDEETPQRSNECHSWRHYGCSNSICGFLHVIENRGCEVSSGVTTAANSVKHSRTRHHSAKAIAAVDSQTRAVAATIVDEPSGAAHQSRYQSAHSIPGVDCYYWCTTGCKRCDKCMYEHRPEKRAIDWRPWMVPKGSRRPSGTPHKDQQGKDQHGKPQEHGNRRR